MMRRVFFLLLALNLLYALWHLVRPAVTPQDEVIQQPDAMERLVLLSEMSAPEIALGEIVVDEVALGESVVPEPGSDLEVVLVSDEGVDSLAGYSSNAVVCARVGRFPSDADLERFLADTVEGRPYLLRSREESLPPLHRVFLPAAADRNQALVVLADVRATIEQARANIDTYLIVGGDFDNVVSLGLFSEPNNALNVQRVLQEYGYQPQIQIENRVRQAREVLVEFEKDSDFEEKTLEVVQTMGLSLELLENLCEMIAQQG